MVARALANLLREGAKHLRAINEQVPEGPYYKWLCNLTENVAMPSPSLSNQFIERTSQIAVAIDTS